MFLGFFGYCGGECGSRGFRRGNVVCRAFRGGRRRRVGLEVFVSRIGL